VDLFADLSDEDGDNGEERGAAGRAPQTKRRDDDGDDIDHAT